MNSPQATLSALLGSLVVLHGLESRRAEILDIFRLLTTESLARAPTLGARRLSTFTADGLPFELSLALSKRAVGGLRYGTEAGDLTSSMPVRLATSHELTVQILSRIGATHGRDTHERLFEIIFPPQILELNGHRFGMWQGMVHRPGQADTLKVYYNLQPWGPDLAAVLDRILDGLHADLDERRLGKLLRHLPSLMRPIFLGVDYGGDEQLRIKFYHRSESAVPRAWITDLLTACEMAEHAQVAEIFFRNLNAQHGNLAPRALLVHVGVDSAGQEPALGLYLPLNRFFWGDAGASQHIKRVLGDLGLDRFLYEQTLEILGVGALSTGAFRHHTLLALGLESAGYKINVYLRPRIERQYG